MLKHTRVFVRGKRLLKQLIGRDVWIYRSIRCRTIVAGSWAFCPDALPPSGAVVYSLGVGSDTNLDSLLIQDHGATVFAFDPTAAEWVAQAGLPPAFRFAPVAVGDVDGMVRFYPRVDRRGRRSTEMFTTVRDPRAGDGFELPMRRLDALMAELGHDGIDLLKMDVEGSEYGILEQVLDRRIPVGQLLVEFHHRFPGIGPAATRRAVERLKRAGWRLFHVSDSGLEYGFLSAQMAERCAPGR